MEKNKIMIRFESMNKYKIKKDIKHNLRTIKISSVVNKNKNILIQEDKFGYISEKTNKKIQEKLFEKLEQIEQNHKILLRKNFNQSLNKRYNSFNSGILTFSEKINEYNLLKNENNFKIFLKKTNETIKNVCKELDIELHYIVVHFDEGGLPHVHFFTNNFNKLGKSISIKTNKRLGEKLQDLSEEYFKEWGFERGISKSITKNKHKSILKYQEAKDLEKLENDKIEKIKELETKENELNDRIKNLELQELELKNKLDQYKIETIEVIIKDLEKLNKEKDLNKFISLVKRYLNNENKLDTLLEKWNQSLKKTKSQHLLG